LYTAENRMSLYITKGTKLNITADNNVFYTSMLITGKGSAENQYIVRKTAISGEINQEEMYSLGETEFLAALEKVKSRLQANFASTKFEDPTYKAKEAKNLWYFEQLFIQNYPDYHAHYAKVADFEASDAFPKLEASIDLDNEQDYLFSNAYKQIVSNIFNETVDRKMNHAEGYSSAVALPEIKKIKSQSFKNAMVKALSYEIETSNPNSTQIYNELMTLTTNSLFKLEMTDKYNKTMALVAGKPSPGFDYENHKGGKTSLESLKGTYVYIDVWATWCGPCREEIPSLQKIEEQFKDKNVRFVSISIDTKKDYEKWRNMVTDKQLGGIQLMADNAQKSQFAKEYAINSIPRFILIDPNGNIANPNAPRPSDPKLLELFAELKI
jgi:thiol-disulfide isomerase/thioredoxin